MQVNNFVFKNDNGITTHKTQPPNQNAASLAGIMILGVFAIGGLILHHFGKSSEVEKWMDVPTAITAFAPEANNDLGKSTNIVEHLQKEVQMAKEELAIKAEMVSVVPSDEQRKIDDLQNQLNIAKENQQNILNSIVLFLID